MPFLEWIDSWFEPGIQSLPTPSFFPDSTFPLCLSPNICSYPLPAIPLTSLQQALLNSISGSVLPRCSLATAPCLRMAFVIGRSIYLPRAKKATIRILFLPIKNDGCLNVTPFQNAHQPIVGKITLALSIPQSQHVWVLALHPAQRWMRCSNNWMEERTEIRRNRGERKGFQFGHTLILFQLVLPLVWSGYVNVKPVYVSVY